MAARSHEVVEIEFCPIAAPALVRQAPIVARAIARYLASGRKPLDVQVTTTATGLDVDLRGHGSLRNRDRAGLIELAAELDLARLSLHGDVIVERRPPTIVMGRAAVVPPPGSFLQATTVGEETLAGLVVEACGGAKRVADLFSGCGPFALRLAEQAEVHAVENDRDPWRPSTGPRGRRWACAGSRPRSATCSGVRCSPPSSTGWGPWCSTRRAPALKLR